MSSPRIGPGGRREIGLVNHAIASIAGRVTGGRAPNIFTTLGRRRGLFRAWLWYSGKMMPGGTLPRHETELVILHVATLRGCEYELVQHRAIARRAGLSAEQIERAGDETWPGHSAREQALLAAATQFVRERDIDDDAWRDLRTHLDEPTTIEFLLLCGQYDSLATTLMTLRVQPDNR